MKPWDIWTAGFLEKNADSHQTILQDVFSSWRSTCFLSLKTEVLDKRRDVGSWEGSWNLKKYKCATIALLLWGIEGWSGVILKPWTTGKCWFCLPWWDGRMQPSLLTGKHWGFSLGEQGGLLQCARSHTTVTDCPGTARGKLHLAIPAPARGTAEDAPGIPWDKDTVSSLPAVMRAGCVWGLSPILQVRTGGRAGNVLEAAPAPAAVSCCGTHLFHGDRKPGEEWQLIWHYKALPCIPSCSLAVLSSV